MTYFVICKSLEYFKREYKDRFNGEQTCLHVNRNEVIVNQKDSYRYLSSIDMLRGYHGVKVVFWGEPPKWYLDEKKEVDYEIKFVELE